MSDGDYVELLAELREQSDRALAVLAGALLEMRIKQSISASISVDDAQIRRLIGTVEKPGLLGFLDQCRLAYALGAFGPKTFADLERIARIRNRFAHRFAKVAFASDGIRELCMALTTLDEFPHPSVLTMDHKAGELTREEVRAEFDRMKKQWYLDVRSDPRTRFYETFRRIEQKLLAYIWRGSEYDGRPLP